MAKRGSETASNSAQEEQLNSANTSENLEEMVASKSSRNLMSRGLRKAYDGVVNFVDDLNYRINSKRQKKRFDKIVQKTNEQGKAPLGSYVWDRYIKGVFVKGIILPTTLVLALNATPGPQQNFVEKTISHAVYNHTDWLPRLPEDLGNFSHSFTIKDRDDRVVYQDQMRVSDVNYAPHVYEAFISCEDAGIESHAGVNKLSFLRASVEYISKKARRSIADLVGADSSLGKSIYNPEVEKGKISRGGSTAAMSVIEKAVGLDHTENGAVSKIKEAMLAVVATDKYPRETILDVAISSFHLHNGMVGGPAGSIGYFAKGINSLNDAQLRFMFSFAPNNNRAFASYAILNGKEFHELSKDGQKDFLQQVTATNTALARSYERGKLTLDEYLDLKLTTPDGKVDLVKFRDLGLKRIVKEPKSKDPNISIAVEEFIRDREFTINGKTISGQDLWENYPADIVAKTGFDLPFNQMIQEKTANFFSFEPYYEDIFANNQGLYNAWKTKNADHVLGDKELFDSWKTENAAKIADKKNKGKDLKKWFLKDQFMLDFYDDWNAGFMAVDSNGIMVARVGGKRFINPKTKVRDQDLLNKQSWITPGSTVKMLEYYAALAVGGINPDRLPWPDLPIRNGPKNSDDRYEGYISLDRTILRSVNTVTYRMWEDRMIRDHAIDLFKKTGMRIRKPAGLAEPYDIFNSPQSFIASYETHAEDILGFIAPFLYKDGSYVDIVPVKKILVNGEVVYDALSRERTPLYSDDFAREYMYELAFKNVTDGSARGLMVTFPQGQGVTGGKTGTHNTEAQNLFAGFFTPHLTEDNHEESLAFVSVISSNSGTSKYIGSSKFAVRLTGQILAPKYEELWKEARAEIDKEIMANDPDYFKKDLTHMYIDKYMDICTGTGTNKWSARMIQGIEGLSQGYWNLVGGPDSIYYQGPRAPNNFKDLMNHYRGSKKLQRAALRKTFELKKKFVRSDYATGK